MFAAFALTAAVSSCNDPQEETGPLTLRALPDKTTILDDGEDMVSFLVSSGSKNVTAQSIIRMNGEVFESENCQFASTNPGAYTFIAEYNGETSNELVITVQNTAPLSLYVDKSIIKNDGSERATFTVMQGKEDVTSITEICSNTLRSCLTEHFYSPAPTASGVQDFYAYFLSDAGDPDKKVSNTVEVFVDNGTTPIKFAKSVAFFNHTGTWCGPCGYLKPALKQIQDETGDKVVIVCFYAEKQANSPLACDIAYGLWREIITAGNVDDDGGSIPSTFLDMRESFVGAYSSTPANYNAIMPTYNRLKGNDAKTGIAVSSKVNGNKIEVKADVRAEVDGQYSVGALLVEDNIVYAQTNQGSKYNHTNVLRANGANSIFGVDMGTITAGEGGSKNFSFDIDTKYVVDNLSVVVYTTRLEEGKKYIANITKCPVNGSVGYKFAK
jgi:thiol-disulfide isomerase/thioredoxin